MDSVPGPLPPAGEMSSLNLPPEIAITASTVAAGWRNVTGFVVEGRVADFYRTTVPDTVVAFHLSAITRVDWKLLPAVHALPQ